MQSGFLRSAILLGLLSCVGPFAIDMYLPALPAVAADLSSTVAAAQWTITAYFFAFGIAQMVYGPLADAYGRRMPMLAGLAVFAAGSLACWVAPTMGWLVAGRFVQALGASAVMVIPRAIIRDLHTGTEATRLMALVMLVISVSPMLAPLAGSGVVAIAGWRAIFAVLCFAAVFSAALVILMLPETLKREDRVPVSVANMAKGARTLLADPYFMGLTFVGGFGMASFFVFLSSAAFIYTGRYGLSPTGFSLAFAANAIGFFTASQFAAPLGARLGMMRLVSVATAGFAATTLALLLLTMAGFDGLYLLIGMLILANAFLGLVIPSSMVMALDPHGEIAGLASSLGGTMQMIAGGLAAAIAGQFFDGTSLPMVAAIAACGAAAFALTRLVLAAPAARASAQ